MFLPSDHDSKVNEVPTISEVSSPVHNEAVSYYLHQALYCEHVCESKLNVIQDLVLLSLRIPV